MTDRETSPGPDPGSDPGPDTVAPTLVDPVLIAAFEGWNDAGEAASTALEHLELTWDATPLASIDPEEYYDFQVTRPHVRLAGGVTRRIEWQTTRLSVAQLPGTERHVVLVNGIEPNLRWRAFCRELLGHVERLGVTKVITLGALLTDTPHTRPTPVTGTSYDRVSASEMRVEPTSYQGPTGIVGVFQNACVEAGVPAISFWAAVPHYVSQARVPKAAVALLHRIEEVLDVEVPLGGLPEQAEEWERTVSEMAEADEEVREYVRQLEEQAEADADTDTLSKASGDEIAADFERYLRRRGAGGTGGG
jgi:proteasome assembly chaperone (PAC2) family protein